MNDPNPQTNDSQPEQSFGKFLTRCLGEFVNSIAWGSAAFGWAIVVVLFLVRFNGGAVYFTTQPTVRDAMDAVWYTATQSENLPKGSQFHMRIGEQSERNQEE